MARILFLPPNHELEGAVEGAVEGAFGSLLGNNFLGSNLAPNSPILVPNPLNQLSSAGAGAGAGYIGAGVGVGAGAGALYSGTVCPPRLLALLCLVKFFGIYNIS